MRRGQSNVISIVLITGILVAAVSSAFLWGLPLLQKGQESSGMQESVETLKEVASAITTVARDKTSRTITFQADGPLRIMHNNTTLQYDVTSEAPYVATGNWLALNEDDFQGIPGVFNNSLADSFGLVGRDKPGVLMVKTEEGGNEARNIFRIVFREIEDLNDNSGRQIILEPQGTSSVTSGKHKLIFEYGREEVESGASKTGGPLRKVYVQVRFA